MLVQLGFLAAMALILGVATSMLANTVAPQSALPLVLAVVLADVAIFIGFGHYLVTRLVLQPLMRLIAAADAVVAGNLGARAPDAETTDLTTLSHRFNRMTDHLLDAQGQLVRAEKLASIGRLAAGIAHEIGNPLGSATTYVEVLRRRDPQAREVVDGLTRELERIDKIVRSLLDYARPQEERVQPVDLRAVLTAAFNLLKAQGAFRRVQASLQCADTLPWIMGRAHPLEQALVNLLLNATVAAADGIVVLGGQPWAYEPGRAPRTRREGDRAGTVFPRGPERRPSRAEFTPGLPGVLLFVADSGPGVPMENREMIFDPFVTTKAPGKGTGLGLAIVARVVDDMGGVVWVDTAREGGAAFKMFFPAAQHP
ncbi:MAG TPA: ATP-binding protein [Gemmatimonadales bacterium]|jgi:signal transduction histidine kinase